MDNIFVVAGIIAFIFLIVKFIEMRFVEKESKPLKYLIRDALLVYFSVLLGNFVFEQVNPIVEVNRATPVFTGNPEF
jgi:TctA family transporter